MNRNDASKRDEERQWASLGCKVFWYSVNDTPGLEQEDEWIQVERGGEYSDRSLDILYQGPDGERFSSFRYGFNTARRIFAPSKSTK